MISHECFIRVTYSETDKMGVVHHSNYARYCENARWEFFRYMGIPYSYVEEKGYLLPVFLMSSSFVAPARYDEKLRIVTCLNNFTGVRLSFLFNIYNESDIQINETNITLACVNKETFKPCALPSFIIEAIGTSRTN
jgi:acyl-CoA thioester hydrolase